jgi:hypothetical protein
LKRKHKKGLIEMMYIIQGKRVATTRKEANDFGGERMNQNIRKIGFRERERKVGKTVLNTK